MIEKPLDLFLNHIRYEKRLSALTIKSYLADLNKLKKLLQVEIQEAKTEDIRLSLSKLHSQGLSSKSLARILSAWRNFFQFLVKSTNLKSDPTSGIRAPKGGKKLPQTLSIDQVFKLIEIKEKDFYGIRDKAILELFYSSGLRLSELTNIRMLDLDMNDRSIQVLGKGNKSRIIPVGGKAFASIQLWINERSKIKNCEESAFLFLNKRGAKLTNRAIQYRLKYWAEKNNIPENIHPHLLRHSFASHVLQSSQDLRAVQELLGHSNISTTQIYTHLDFQHLAKIYDQSHPRSKKKMD